MARKNKVSLSSEPAKYRLSSAERHALRIAEIAGKQAELKREAAERRALRSRDGAAKGNIAPATAATKPASPRKADPS